MTAPHGLDHARHVDLAGRSSQPFVRRALLVVLAVVALLALDNQFGQRPSTSRASAAFATLEVQSPARLRGGLIYQTRVRVTARTAFTPTVVLQKGWLESNSVNSLVPDPTAQRSLGGNVYLTYPRLAPGQTATYWMYFQVNPTNVGERSEHVVLEGEGGKRLELSRSLTVFP